MGAATCTSPACCQPSKCYSDFVPGLKCSRGGGAKCIGGKLSSMTKGTCQCKYGACSNGRCPSQSNTLGGVASSLFDDNVPSVAAEDEEESTLVEHMPLIGLSASLFVGLAVVGMRVHRNVRSRAAA